MTTSLKLPSLLLQLQKQLADTSDVYLVGGAVRDALLGKASHDLDFVVNGDSLAIARRLANQLNGAYYTMDEDFMVGRVVLDKESEQRTVLDFVAMQGDSLDEDLSKRDFTVNAMALSLNDLTTVIDPLGGGADLLKGQLQFCSPTAFADDPVRVMRALRIAASYQLSIHPKTRDALKQAVHLLPTVSIERLRDELFKLLDAPRPSANLRVMDLLGISDHLLPETGEMKAVTQSAPHIYGVWEHAVHTVSKLEDVLRLLDKNYQHDNEGGGDIFSGVLSLRLGRYRDRISEHFNRQLNPDRSISALLFFAGLYHDITKPRHRSVEEDGRIRFIGHEQSGAQVTRQRAEALRLSTQEAQRIETVVAGHMRPWQLAKTGELPTKRAVYRFWRAVGEAGVDICLLSIADLLAIYGHTLPQPVLEHHIDVVRTLLEAYWEKPEEVKPQAFLNGDDLLEMFELRPGPVIGDLLESLWEAQAVGEVEDKTQAVEFIRKKIRELPEE
ncbi:MAG: HD domain-containing protein [Chloroflexota bacterium]